MKKELSLTERAVDKLNHIALSLHYTEFKKRLDRLHGRLIGNRPVVIAIKAENNCNYCELENPCAEDCGNCRR